MRRSPPGRQFFLLPRGMEARGCFRPRQGVTARPVRGKGTGWISHTAAASRRCVFRLKVEAGHPRERPAVPMAPSDAAAAAGTLSTAARCRVGSPCAPRVGLERPAMVPLPHMSSSRLHSGFRQRQQAGALETLRDLGGALEVAAAYGVRRLAAAVADGPGWNRALHRIVTTGPGCNPAFQGDAISTGGSRDAWGGSCRRAVAGGETVAQRGAIWRSTSSGARIGVRNSGRNRWAAGRWRRPAHSINVGSSARGSFGVRPGMKPCRVWTPSGATSAGLCSFAHTRPGNLSKN